MRGKEGFTLVEVLVALVILTLALGMVVGSFGSSLRIARESRLNALASEYAQAVAEHYRTHWSNPAHFASGSTPPGLDALAGRLAGAGLSAQVEASLRLNPDGSAYTGSGQPPLRRVVVTVRRGSEIRARVMADIGNPSSSGLR
ncbi:MAG: type II secretion system GspH family protein [Meiothermus sp.]|uniref:type II secretion system protein n=1 Tax=Meiothermus sp. TaxID=1955249 RepID=UPI0025E38B5F|nr:type II secretion system protein [Meiothermus sp.]MCS7059506.1 type II secretion system GspH family protein [Meiothermus sp.]MCS7194082.1 type II secretion system GspH family protein [Meiothermus sp.]